MAVGESATLALKASDPHYVVGRGVNLCLPIEVCGEMPAKSPLQSPLQSPIESLIKSTPAPSTKKSIYFNRLVYIGARTLGQVRGFVSSTYSVRGSGSGSGSGSDPGSYTGYLARCGT